MSNEVYGYMKVPYEVDWFLSFKEIERRNGIGIKEIPMSTLYGFPQEVLPVDHSGYTAFIIGDHPGKTSTSYLTDYINYEPTAAIGLPTDAKERLGLLVGSFMHLIEKYAPIRFVVLLTVCNQVSTVKHVDAQNLEMEIRQDFERCDAPPDCIYDVSLEE